MPNTDIRGRLADLGRQACQVRHCRGTRHQLSRYCHPHMIRLDKHGHPEGRPIRRDSYRKERAQIAEVLDAHRGHAAIATGLRVIAELLEGALANPTASPAHYCLARLARQAIAPSTVLTEAAALFLYSRRYPHALPDDDRLTFAIGKAVALLTPQECLRVKQHRTRIRRVYKQVPKSARRGIGYALREDLAPLFVNLWQAAEEIAARPTKRRKRMLTPISGASAPTPSSTTKEAQQ